MNISEKISRTVRNLPTLPTIYSHLADAMSNPRTTNDDIAKIVSNDQAATFKVLRVANSPFYGFMSRIDTISQAILHLGFNEIRNIVLALSIINLFSKKKLVMNFRPVDYWGHSIGVGIATRLIGGATGVTNLENFFVAGILHDLGKLLFFELADKEYEKVLLLVDEKKCLIKDAEREILGIDHAEAGRLLAERWKLPSTIRDAIFFHHSGFVNGKSDVLVASVHVADILARMLELGYPGDDFVPEPNVKAWEILKLEPNVFTRMEGQLLQNYEETIGLLLST